MTAFAQNFLTSHNNANQGTCPSDISDNGNGQVAGYAILAEILQQNTADAVNYLNCFCATTWSTDKNQAEAIHLASGAIAYDVLFNESGLNKTACANKIAAAASDFYNAYTNPSDPGGYWRDDIDQNHLWVNMAALGIAGEALKGENSNTSTWLSVVDQAFQKIAAVQDLTTDGSWHEGRGYHNAALFMPSLYYLGAARAGNADRSNTAMLLNTGKYLIQAQKPNDPRFFTASPGDWVWVRPQMIGILRFVAGHLASVNSTLAGYAQAAADRWDLIPRSTQTFWLNRWEFALAYGLEFAAYDESVASVDPAISLPLANYNDNEGSFIMRSSWSYATSGAESKGMIITLKNGFLGGKGMAQAVASCGNIPSGGSSWYVNFGHDHFDDFGLYIYGNGGWLLPESTGYNCCGNDRFGSDLDAYHDSYYHNTITFGGGSGSNGNGQILDNWVASRGVHGSTTNCGQGTDVFFTRVPANPFHHNTQDFAIGQADGSRIYRNVSLSRALRTVGFDRETNVIVLADDIALSSGSQTIQQHFHSMNASGSLVDSGSWIKLDNTTTGGSGSTVPNQNTVLAVKVLAPTSATLSVTSQSGNQYTEWMSPNGNYGHAVVSAPASSSRRFLALLWPTDTANYASRPNVAALDSANPDRGLSVPLASGGVESWILNTLGTTTTAGAFKIAGSSVSDVGVVRTDSAGALMRTMAEAAASAQLYDTNGTRLILDLAGNSGAMEVRYESSNAYVVTSDSNGSAVAANGQKFYAATAPASVRYNGALLTSGQYSYDATAKLVTLSPTSPMLTVTVSGSGSVSSTPVGIDGCTTNCSASYGPGTSVTLAATPGPGATFAGWSGGGCSGTGNCVVVMNSSTSVTATFNSAGVALFVNKDGAGGGTVTSSPAGINCGASCTASFPQDSSVTLTAAASAGSTFAGWAGGGCSGTGSCVVTMSATTTVTATFNATQYSLTVNKGGTGSGTVTSSPAGISCGTTCIANFAAGSSVTLTATPDASMVFSGWSGGGCSGTGSCVLTMNANTILTATFNSNTYSDAVWVKQLGSNADEYGWGAATDSSGNVIMTGYTTGNLPGPNQGLEDVSVAKYNASGTLLWTAQLGSGGNEHAFAVATDASGNIYVTGYTTDAMWGAYFGGAHDAFVAKFGPNGGGELWSNPIGSTGDDIAYAIAVDPSGNIYVAGSTTGSFGGSNAGGKDGWVAKYDQSMNPAWVRHFGGTGNEVARGVAVDASGNVYVAGYTSGAFGGQTYNGGANDAFLVKYNSGGTLQWTQLRGTAGDDKAYAVAVTAGNPIVCGSTSGDLGFTNSGGLDAWIGEYRANDAGYVLERQVGGVGDDEAFGIAANAAGDIFITGSNTAAMYVNFEGGYDIFAAKYDAGGTRQWIKNLGSSGNDVGLAVAVSGSSVYVIGGTTSSLGGPFAGGGYDIIVAQFAQ